MPEAFFWLFAAALVASALGVVASRQALSSVLWMAGAVLSCSGILAYLGATLLALLMMLIYAGAILVLFAFVVLFIGQRDSQKSLGSLRLIAGGAAVMLVALFAIPLFAQKVTPHDFAQVNTLSDSIQYGLLLFSDYLLPVQLCGWLLLWATIGAFNIVKNSSTTQGAKS